MMVGEFCVVVIIMSDNSVVNLLLVIVGGFVGLIVFLCQIGDNVICFDCWEMELNEVFFGDVCDIIILVSMVVILCKLLISQCLSVCL